MTQPSPATSRERDPQQQLAELLQELESRAGTEDVRLLWVLYVALYVEVNDMPTFAATDLDAVTQEIASSIETLDLAQVTDAMPLAREVLQARVDGRAYVFDPSQRSKSVGGDPVVLFNGEFMQHATDLAIDGAGQTFAFQRTYRNQAGYSGPLGANWSHNYDLRLKIVGDTALVSGGALRTSLYTRHPQFGQAGFNYFVPPDGEHAVLLEQPPSFVLRMPDGSRYVFEVDPALALQHRIARIEDRHGNFLAFQYRDAIDGQLGQVVVNNPGRIVTFGYDGEGRIDAVSDYTGRNWAYRYDDFGDLVAVTTPATADAPEGCTTRYEYSSSEASGPLAHNLVRIVDAEGHVYLENEFGMEASLLAFNRVVRQRLGDGFYLYDYANVVEAFDIDYDEAERPAHQVTMTDRNGHETVNVFNRFGNLIAKQERVVLHGRLVAADWRYRYNADGMLVAQLSPQGRVTQYLFARELFTRRHSIVDAEVPIHNALTDTERLAFANLLAVVRRGALLDIASLSFNQGIWGNLFPDVLSANASDIIVKTTYEANYQQVATVSDPRFTASADPSFAESARYQETLTQYDYVAPGGSGFPAPAGLPQPSTANLYLRRIRRPDVTLPDGSRLTGQADECLRYDAKGRILEARDAGGTSVVSEPFASIDGVREGYLRRKTIDPGGLALITTFEVNPVGIVTAIVAPKGQALTTGEYRTSYIVNALDQHVQVTRSAPFLFSTRTAFDRNGDPVRDERDLRDETGAPLLGGVEVKTYRYDAEQNLIRETSGGSDLSRHLAVSHHYDGSGHLVRTVQPGGNETWFEYDERSLQTAVVRAACTDIASISRTVYDEDGRTVAILDPRGFATTQIFDAFGRVTVVTDPLGHQTRVAFDKAGNVTVRRLLEKQANGSFKLLARSEFSYDELNRQISERHNVFAAAAVVSRPDTDFIAAGPGTLAVTSRFFDRAGRVATVIDAEGQRSVTAYDAAGRPTRQTDAANHVTVTSHDANGNVVRRDVHEQIVDPATGSVTEEVFSTLHEYDQLDRLIATTDAMGNRSTYAYDSRDNIVRQTDALGNVRRFTFDIFNRRVAEHIDLTDTGLGSGAPAATLTTTFDFDGNGNVVRVVDSSGNVSTRVYDALDRRTVTGFADATTEQIVYDPAGNVTRRRDANGVVTVCRYDPLNRRLRTDIDASGAAGLVLEGETFASTAYDGAGRPLREANDFAIVTRDYDSLGRPLQERQDVLVSQLGVAAVRAISRTFDLVGNQTSLTYPGGRLVRRHVDALNRTARIENVSRGAGYPGATAGPDQHDIVVFSQRGWRRVRADFGNGASAAYAYDGSARLIELQHRAADGSSMLSVQHLYDAVSSMRVRNEAEPGRQGFERFSYNSAAWLTRTEAQASAFAVGAISALAPATVPLPASGLTGQSRMNGVIGALADNPVAATFRYDGCGNRLEQRQVNQPPLSYGVNTLNQYTSIGATQAGYDRSGNLTSDGVRTYIYDHRNLLVRVVSIASGQTIARFVHDAQGRRIASEAAGVVTTVVLDGSNIVAEYRGTTLWAQYVHDAAVDGIIQLACQGDDLFYHRDLTSVRVLSNSAGAQAGAYRYDVFGAILQQPALYNPITYQCRVYDAAIGSYDFRRRQYLPQLGRFAQRDSVEATNAYTFLRNNPLTGVDPHGMDRKARLSEGMEEFSHQLRQDPASCMERVGSDSCGQSYVTYQDWYIKQRFAEERQNQILVQLLTSSSQPGFAVGAFLPFVFGRSLEAQMAAGSVTAAAFSFGNTGMVPRRNSASDKIIFENIQLPYLRDMAAELMVTGRPGEWGQAQRMRNMVDIARTDSRQRSADGQRIDSNPRNEAANKMPKREPASGAVIIDVVTGRVYWGISGFYGSGPGALRPLRIETGLNDRYNYARSLQLRPRDPFQCGEMMAQNRALLDGAQPGNLVMMSFGIRSFSANPTLRLDAPVEIWPLCPNCRITTHPDITVIQPSGARPLDGTP